MTVEKTAHAAKHRFRRRLRDVMAQRQWAQKDIAELTGASPSSVSIYMRDPDMITSDFIRKISVLVPALGREYQLYMSAVDGPLLSRRSAVDVLRADERLAAFDAAVNMIHLSLENIRKLLE